MTLEQLTTSKIATLEDAIAIIRLQAIEIARLQTEVRRLSEEVARLSKNSRNSSKPPSSDITKPPGEQRQPGKRKRGGQRGHFGCSREPLPREKLNGVKEVELKKCPDCGEELNNERTDEIKRDQIAELVSCPVEVIEYLRYGHVCPKCNVVHYPKLPEGLIEGQPYGIRLQSLLVYLKGALGASYSEIAELSRDVFNLPISRAGVCNAINRGSEALAEPYFELQEALSSEEELHADESGWKDSGKRFWVWLFCNQTLAFFYISPSRGAKVLKEVLGEVFNGRLTSDFYGAYINYAGARLQLCLAHLIRDIKYLATLPDPAAQAFGKKLLQHFRIVFRLWHNRGLYSPEEFQRRVRRFEPRLRNFLFSLEFERGPARTMQRRLVKHWNAIFRFLHHPQLYEPTNNEAEQTMRVVVRIRRQTQGSRSVWGQLWASRILTVLGTCRKQQRSSWAFINQALSAFHFGTKTPSLLPTSG